MFDIESFKYFFESFIPKIQNTLWLNLKKKRIKFFQENLIFPLFNNRDGYIEGG